MKRLLFQFDTDPYPSAFDTVVAYDGGADHVIGYGGVHPGNVKVLLEGAIFTRAPKEKKNTAIFVGGSDMAAGERLFAAVQKHFFHDFRVSVMLDSNGSNTTAAAGIAKIQHCSKVAGKKAVVLAGTGPVGRRAAAILAREGAQVALTSRTAERAKQACQDIQDKFQLTVEPIVATTLDARGEAIAEAQVVFASGAAGVELLRPDHWQDNHHIEIMADANATPPIGIGGTDMMDCGKNRHGKIVWGAIGFGALKLAVHRSCIAKLFERNDQLFDAEEIFTMAKCMA